MKKMEKRFGRGHKKVYKNFCCSFKKKQGGEKRAKTLPSREEKGESSPAVQLPSKEEKKGGGKKKES